MQPFVASELAHPLSRRRAAPRSLRPRDGALASQVGLAKQRQNGCPAGSA